MGCHFILLGELVLLSLLPAHSRRFPRNQQRLQQPVFPGSLPQCHCLLESRGPVTLPSAAHHVPSGQARRLPSMPTQLKDLVYAQGCLEAERGHVSPIHFPLTGLTRKMLILSCLGGTCVYPHPGPLCLPVSPGSARWPCM